MANAGVHSVKVKGKIYHYHRATRRRLPDEPTSAEFIGKLNALNDLIAIKPEVMPGTIGALMAAYRAADVFLDLKPKTRQSYRQIMRVLEPLDAQPLDVLTPVYVAAVRDRLARSRGRRTANYAMAILSVVSKYGIETGAIAVNPCASVRRVKRPRDAVKANRPWTSVERRMAIEHMPPHVGLMVALAMFTGLRRTDCCELPKDAYADGFLKRRTSKTGQVVRLPVHPDLARMLDAMPKHGAKTLLATSRGKSWTPDGFETSFGKARNELMKQKLVGEGLTFHGLRHTVGSLLRGCTDDIDLIRRWLGQKTLHMAMMYSAEADTSAEFSEAMGRFDPLG